MAQCSKPGNHIRDVINRFVQTRSVNKGKSTARFPESEEPVEN
jgi:hypothetical protein